MLASSSSAWWNDKKMLRMGLLESGSFGHADLAEVLQRQRAGRRRRGFQSGTLPPTSDSYRSAQPHMLDRSARIAGVNRTQYRAVRPVLLATPRKRAPEDDGLGRLRVLPSGEVTVENSSSRTSEWADQLIRASTS